MLTYLNKGVRTSSLWPLQGVTFTRNAWEFMAILNGEASPQFAGNHTPEFAGPRLYVLPPGSKHTWNVRTGKQCEVIVMHFDALPQCVQNLFSPTDPFSLPLSPEDVTWIQSLYTKVFPHYYKPCMESILWNQQTLLELCVFTLSKIEQNQQTHGIDRNAERSHKAMQYYREHLSEHLTVRDICKALHISTPQLRRIFKDSLNQTPKETFTNIALQEACKLAVETPLSFKQISFSCGFAGFPQFYRAFRQKYGFAPNEWRRKHQLAAPNN